MITYNDDESCMTAGSFRAMSNRFDQRVRWYFLEQI
ncbi:hypothetical protein T05_1756 [Trichinella murrelli]|uniref:Uncharacterized protein n=1 Tax=Trichinella murrelli TaxID=144512 RepID=A0A0V0SR21_9BILA|nr:hypothetical protein T05_1756 [Trichinella murrelli]